MKKTGIYKISCNDCDKFYIGQTGRAFQTRFKEHLPKAKNNLKSNYAAHLVNENHSYTDFETNMIPLHYCNKGNVMNALEEFEIYNKPKFSPTHY